MAEYLYIDMLFCDQAVFQKIIWVLGMTFSGVGFLLPFKLKRNNKFLSLGHMLYHLYSTVI